MQTLQIVHVGHIVEPPVFAKKNLVEVVIGGEKLCGIT
jgi:hypothetical protein